LIKAQTGEGIDPLQAMADDMTTKEPMGIVYSDVSSFGLKPLSVTSDYMKLEVKEKDTYDRNVYAKVFNLHESNKHPFNFDMNYDIFIGKNEMPITLIQK